MNVVLDTNILIAAFIAKGVCHTLVEHCLRVHSVITSEFMQNELREKLVEKFKYSMQMLPQLKRFYVPRWRLLTRLYWKEMCVAILMMTWFWGQLLREMLFVSSLAIKIC